MSTWFATTASLTAIRQGWTLTPFHEGLLTSSVQAGFVAGTLTSALLSAADRYDLRRLFATSAAIAGRSQPAHRPVRADRRRHSTAALRHRLLPRRRLSGRHEDRLDLGQGRPRPAHRTARRRGDTRLGGAASVRDRRARLAPPRRCRGRVGNPRGHPDPLGRDRSEPRPGAALPPRQRVRRLPQRAAAARELRLLRPHVGTLRDVDVDRQLPRRELRAALRHRAADQRRRRHLPGGLRAARWDVSSVAGPPIASAAPR